MKCQHCGKEIENGSAFCLYCGAKIVPTITCPHCNALIPEGDAFCMSCGWKVDKAEISRILEEKEKERVAKEHEAAAKKAEVEAREAAKQKERALSLFQKAKEELKAKHFDLALSSITESLKIESTTESKALKDQILDSLRIYYKEAIVKATEDKKFSVARKYANEAQKYFSSEEWLPSAISEIKKQQDKKLYKSIGIVLLVFIGLIVIGSLLPEKDTSTGNPEASTLSSSPENKSEAIISSEVSEAAEEEEEDLSALREAQIYEELYDCNYHGTIDGKYPITAHVLFSTLGAEGSYYYDKNGADRELTLVGTYESYGDELWVVLKEYNKDGKHTGTFYVKKSTEDRSEISGTFVLESNGKEMPFELSTNEVQPDYSSSYGYAAGQRVLSESELQAFSQEELRILRNEVYARHGHIFKSQDLTSYFSRFDWYHPDTNDAFDRLSEMEKNNILIIKEVESSAPSRYLDLANEIVCIK